FNPVRHTTREIVHEDLRVLALTLANEPRRDELRVAVDGDPRPYIPRTELAPALGGNVLLLRADIAPDLVTFDTLAGKIAQHGVLILARRAPESQKERLDRVLRDSCHAHGRANRIALNEHRYDGCLTVTTQVVDVKQYRSVW